MMQTRRWAWLALVLACGACGDAPTDVQPGLYTYAAPADIGDGLGGADAASVGINAAWFETMVRQIEDGLWPNIHSVLIYRSGELVLEEYFSGVMRSDSTYRDFGRDSLHDVYSVSKSFASATVGVAIASGAIASVDEPVVDFFPEYAYLGGSLATGELTVRHLLTMSAGLEWDETSTSYTDPSNSHAQMRAAADPIEFVFSRAQVAPPGTEFVYSTGLTSVLGELVSRATGELYSDYIAQVIFAPLGITEFDWLDFYNGTLETAGGGLQLRPRDMLKFGVTYLDGGSWQGSQVVPEAWVVESTAPHPPAGYYGYLWWLGARSVDGNTWSFFRALGLGGQHIFVFPEIELVVVFTSNGSGSGPYDLMDRYILPAIS